MGRSRTFFRTIGTTDYFIPEVQKSYYFTDTGFIAQNVYLFAASEGLAAWFHNCRKELIIEEFDLRKNQLVLFAQTVGYPVEGIES